MQKVKLLSPLVALIICSISPVALADVDTDQRAALFNNKGVIALNNGVRGNDHQQLEQAIRFFKMALMIRPGYSYAKDNLSIAYTKYAANLPPERAILFLRKAYELQPNNGSETKEKLDATETLLKETKVEPSPTKEDRELLQMDQPATPTDTVPVATPKP